MTPREKWKYLWRLTRIAKRESFKATQDMTLYGSGFVFIDNETGEAKHIPLKDVVLI